MENVDIHSTRKDAHAHANATGTGAESAGCGCGEHDVVFPELDVQTIPHAVRHAAIFGALESLRPEGGLVISATHDPVPLLGQLRQRHGDTFAVNYLESGPTRWRIEIRRVV